MMTEKSEMIFGVRAVIEAIQAGKEIDKILVKRDIQSDLSKELFAVLKGTLIPVQRVPVERINRITRKNHQGVVAYISSITYQKTEDLVPFLFEEGKNFSFTTAILISSNQIIFRLFIHYFDHIPGDFRTLLQVGINKAYIFAAGLR